MCHCGESFSSRTSAQDPYSLRCSYMEQTRSSPSKSGTHYECPVFVRDTYIPLTRSKNNSAQYLSLLLILFLFNTYTRSITLERTHVDARAASKQRRSAGPLHFLRARR